MVVFMGVQGYMAGDKGRQDERGNMIGEPEILFWVMDGVTDWG